MRPLAGRFFVGRDREELDLLFGLAREQIRDRLRAAVLLRRRRRGDGLLRQRRRLARVLEGDLVRDRDGRPRRFGRLLRRGRRRGGTDFLVQRDHVVVGRYGQILGLRLEDGVERQ